MKKARRIIGTPIYWLAFPALWLILNNSERSRLVMYNDGKILVVKGFLGTGKWGLPGGGLHKDESPPESLLREVKEELGIELDPKNIKPLVSEPLKMLATKLTLHYFAAAMPKGQQIKLQKFEIGEYAWVGPEELNSKNANKDTLRAVDVYGQTAP